MKTIKAKRFVMETETTTFPVSMLYYAEIEKSGLNVHPYCFAVINGNGEPEYFYMTKEENEKLEKYKIEFLRELGT